MASTTTNGASHTNGTSPKLTLYTNHGCPWAHRAHITLKELNLPYEEVIIDLGRPREEWYLKINPRGLVPSLKITHGPLNSEIITESAIVSQFLADSFPSPTSTFFPASTSPTGPLTRARIAFFVDAWFSKVHPFLRSAVSAKTAAEEEDVAVKLAATIAKEIEPLLQDAKPFFGGSESMTLAEALTGPFVIRLKAYMKHGLLHQALVKGIKASPRFCAWMEEVVGQESVTGVFDEEKVITYTKEMVAKQRLD